MNQSYAKQIVENTYTGGYPMSAFLHAEEIYDRNKNKGTGGGSAAPTREFNKNHFANLVIPLGIDSHVNSTPFVPEAYNPNQPIKTIDAGLFDALFAKVAVVETKKS